MSVRTAGGEQNFILHLYFLKKGGEQNEFYTSSLFFEKIEMKYKILRSFFMIFLSSPSVLQNMIGVA